uniref:GAG-pre-integrase domain-containing protein n=1 Tax=Tanacetum cinerariifolium TaxID=118510 RepID=A0A699HYW0_TANCI|nr:hypothetical protein [Tanacetum cinerariifolium]
MFEISGNNFNDWFRQLKLVLRVERKLFVIEQPISLASPTDSEYLCNGMWYMIHNEVACLMLGNNCHYAPSITRGVVSVHRVVENGLVESFMNYGISISKNDVLYFNDIARKGIYEIDMHNLVPNVNSIYNVSTKRAKHNLDSTYLWHCRLAHISKKRIEKQQQEGLLK